MSRPPAPLPPSCVYLPEGPEPGSAPGRLALANDALATYWARRYANRSGLPFEDAIQEARVGLLLAALAHDPSRARYATLASRAAQHRLAAAHELQTPGAIKPKSAAVWDAWLLRRGDPAAERWPPDRHERAAKASRCLEMRDCGEGPLGGLSGEVPDPDTPIFVEELLARLDERSAYVLRRLYGVGVEEGTARDLARELGIKTRRVYQIAEEAVETLRAPAREEGR